MVSKSGGNVKKEKKEEQKAGLVLLCLRGHGKEARRHVENGRWQRKTQK